MTARDDLMRSIQVYDFTIFDLQLYLDTHPTCADALQYFHDCVEKKHAAVTEYTRLYGPITAEQMHDRNRWTWVQSPWPWEGGAN